MRRRESSTGISTAQPLARRHHAQRQLGRPELDHGFHRQLRHDHLEGGDFPVFSAGTDATGSYTITANSPHTIAGMQVANSSGIVTINGPGVLSIADGMQGFIGTNLTINAVLGGTGGFEGQGGCNVI